MPLQTKDVSVKTSVKRNSSEHAMLIVSLNIPAQCHIESHNPAKPFMIPTELKLQESADFSIESVEYPPSEQRKLTFSKDILDVYSGTVAIRAKIVISNRKNPCMIKGTLRYQVCTETVCMMPKSQELAWEIVL